MQVVLRVLKPSQLIKYRKHLLTLAAFAAFCWYGFLQVRQTARFMARRANYPFELEWMEGGMLQHALRVVEGRPLYAEPAPEFMAFLYAPLYHWVSAFAVTIGSVGLPALRAVSIIAFVCATLLLAWLVFRTTRSRLLALIAAVLFVSTYRLNGFWFDLARVDSLANALSLATVALAFGSAKLWRYALCGTCLALAFLTKQSTLALAPALGLYVIYRGGFRGALALTVPALLISGGVTLWQQLVSDGWYWYYTVELPSTHGTKGREFLVEDFWRHEIFSAMPIVGTLAVLALLTLPKEARNPSPTSSSPPPTIKPEAEQAIRLPHEGLFARGVCAMLLIGSYLTRLHMGSSLNDLIPAHIALIWLACLTLSEWPGKTSDKLIGGSLRGAIAPALTALQLFLLSTPAMGPHIVPTQADLDAGQAVVERIRKNTGKVLVVNHPHLSILAGKPSYAHQMAMIDVFYAERDPRGVREILRRKWTPLLAGQAFSEVIGDDNWYVFLKELRMHYVETSRFGFPKDALRAKTGTRLRPDVIWRPRLRTHTSDSQ